MERVVIVYITSRGHSGSTLLDLLLSSHSRIASVGELKMLSPRRVYPRTSVEKPCACGAPSRYECGFWTSVDRHMREHWGISLWDTDHESEDAELFQQYTRATFSSVAAVSGCNIIVDSSKNVDRLKKLLEAGVFDVRIIHLVRSPWGVVYSNVKRGRDWRVHAEKYRRGMVQTRRLLRGHPHLRVSYEKLAKNPRRAIKRIVKWLGLPFEESMMQWAECEHHNFAGNMMRFSSSSEIRIDNEWRSALDIRRKWGIARHVAPALLPDRFNHWLDRRRRLRAKKG